MLRIDLTDPLPDSALIFENTLNGWPIVIFTWNDRMGVGDLGWISNIRVNTSFKDLGKIAGINERLLEYSGDMNTGKGRDVTRVKQNLLGGMSQPGVQRT